MLQVLYTLCLLSADFRHTFIEAGVFSRVAILESFKHDLLKTVGMEAISQDAGVNIFMTISHPHVPVPIWSFK